MASGTRTNYLAGEWRAAVRGASFQGAAGAGDVAWPQSDGADVGLALEAARAARDGWRRVGPRERARLLGAMARALEDDRLLLEELGQRFVLRADELAPHVAGLERDLDERLQRAVPAAAGVTWLAPDWRELVRAPLLDLARELMGGRVVVLVSDARMPELGQHIARAAGLAGLPAGVVGLLHGAARELLALGFAGAGGRADCTLVASGSVERVLELRRLEGQRAEREASGEARLRALRAGVYEVDPARAPEESAAEVLERAFGPGRTLGGQLPGSLGRVFCPPRSFSRFSALFLEQLEASAALRAPVAQLDGDGAARVRAAWELGLDEGATCIAGGAAEPGARVLPPTVFTNVEPYMASAKRQDPLPVLCFLRGG